MKCATHYIYKQSVLSCGKPNILITGVDIGKFNSYMYKVNVPCKKCHNLVKVGVEEKISICPFCNTEWNGK
jgi:hypothetical protein